MNILFRGEKRKKGGEKKTRFNHTKCRLSGVRAARGIEQQ